MRFYFNKKFLILFTVLVTLSFVSKVVFAAWSGTFYEPGDTLNPECLPTDVDCDVRAPLTSTSISDTVYGAGWDGDTTHAPSKNAVYDKIETVVGSAHDALTLGTANGLSLVAQVLSMNLSSGTTTGALSSSDWTTFNNKADALGADDNYVTDAEKTKLSNLSGTNTGDQTSIVGITGTLAQFNTAVTDADLARTDAANTFTGTQTGVWSIPAGTSVSAPGYQFDDADTGFYGSSTSVNFTLNGTRFLGFDANGVTAFDTLGNRMVFNSTAKAIGAGSGTTEWTLVSGSSGNTYFGNGITDTSPRSSALIATGGSGTNVAGASLTLAGGKATGNAAGGSVIFSTSDAGSSGTTLQTLTEKMRISAAGNVGIGTNTPSYKLDVISGTSGNNPLVIQLGGLVSSATSDYSTIRFQETGTYSNAYAAIAAYGQGGINGLRFYTKAGGDSPTERLRIEPTGYVGIGDTSPDYLLDVAGTAGFDGLVTFGTSPTSPGSGSNTERWGAGASTGTATDSVAIGTNASVTGGAYGVVIGTSASSYNGGIAIGQSAATISTGGIQSTDSIAIGRAASAKGWNDLGAIAIGSGASANAQNASIAIGDSASTGAYGSIVIGDGLTATGGEQFLVGGIFVPISDIYFGNGVTNSSPKAVKIQNTGASGTNIAGASLTLAGGKATGNAAGGSIIFSTSDAGASSSTLQSLTTKWQITAAGNLIAGADNSYDIGASGATRPRTGYFGTSIISPLVNGLTITNNGTNTLNIAAGKTLTASNSLTLAGTDSTTMTFPSTSATIARTDAAQTFTGDQSFSGNIKLTTADGGTTGIKFGTGTSPAIYAHNNDGPLCFKTTSTQYSICMGSPTTYAFYVASDFNIAWSSGTNLWSAGPDTGLARAGAGQVRVTDGSTGTGILIGKPGSGTNVAGGDNTIAGGKATGNAAGGSIIFSTSDAGASGTTLQSLTEKMRINYDGKVGIGDTTPDYLLDVAGTAGFDGQVLIYDGTATSPGLGFASDTDTGLVRTGANEVQIMAGGQYSGLYVGNATAKFGWSSATLSTGNGAGYLTVDAGGYADALRVHGGLALTSNNNYGYSTNEAVFNSNPTNFTNYSVAGTYATFATNRFGVMNMTASGGQAITITDNATVKIDGAPTVSGAGIAQTRAHALWVVGGQSVFGGNVGIGTSTPSYLLDISTPNTSITNMLSLSDGLGNQIEIAQGGYNDINAYGTAPLRLYTDESDIQLRTGTIDPAIIIKQSGLVGIGTTAPDKVLELNLGTSSALRLSYNDNNGSAANYADFTVDSSGNLTLTPSGGTTTIAGAATLGSGTEAMRITTDGNLKIAGTATRATTEGTNHIDIFDGTAPVGTLANGISLYSTSGELRVMDAAGNATLLSPHENEHNYWVFDSANSETGKTLVIDMELLVKDINSAFNWDYVHEVGGDYVKSEEPSLIQGLFAKISSWLADTTNGITKIFTNEIETKTLCVTDDSGEKTCITKEQLDALLINAGSSGSSSGSSSSGGSSPEPSSEPTPEPSPIEEPAPSPDPAPEPAPEPVVEDPAPVEEPSPESAPEPVVEEPAAPTSPETTQDIAEPAI